MSFEPFEERLRQRMEDAEVIPSPELWDRIATQLQPPKKRRGAVIWLWPASISAAACILLAILFWPPTDTPQLEQAPSTHVQELSMEERSTDQRPNIQETFKQQEEDTADPLTENTFADSKLSQTSEIKIKNKVGRPLSPNGEKEVFAQINVKEDQVEQNRGKDAADEFPISFPSLTSISSHGFAIEEHNLPAHPSATVTPLSFGYPLKRRRIEKPGLTWQLAPRREIGSSNSLDFANTASADALPEASFADNRGVTAVSEPESNQAELYRESYPQSFISLGLGAEWFLSPKISVQSGINYARTDRGTVELGEFRSLSDSLSLQYADFSNPETRSFTTEAWEVPLSINYYMGNGKSTFVISGGTIFSMYRQGTPDAFRSLGNALAAASQPSNSFQASLRGSLSYQYQMGKNWALFGGPSIRYTPGAENSGLNGIAAESYRFGLELGLKFQFPKK